MPDDEDAVAVPSGTYCGHDAVDVVHLQDARGDPQRVGQGLRGLRGALNCGPVRQRIGEGDADFDNVRSCGGDAAEGVA